MGEICPIKNNMISSYQKRIKHPWHVTASIKGLLSHFLIPIVLSLMMGIYWNKRVGMPNTLSLL